MIRSILLRAAAACVIGLMFAVAAPAASQPGTSFASAVVVDAASEMSGTVWEYNYIGEHFPGAKVVRQALSRHGNKPYDVLTLKFDDGTERTLYFDISSYFGH